MRWMDRLASARRSVFGRQRVESELDAELQFHLDQQIEEHVAAGMAAEEARSLARRSLGGLIQVKEQCRDSLGLTLVDDLLQDVRYAVRTMTRNPSFTIAAVVTLALGIGATTAIFSVVDAILLRPLPYKNSDRIVRIVSHRMDGSTPVRTWTMAWPYFVGLRERTHTLSAVGGYDSFSNLTRQRLTMPVEGEQGAAELFGTRMSPVLFSMLGVQPALGRFFDVPEEQTGRNNVIILSYRAWRAHYGGDPSVLGRLFTLDGRGYSLVGVMPAGFEFPDRQTDFWIPLTPAPVRPPSVPRSDSPNSAYADSVFGLLADGVASQTAAAEVESILRRLSLERAEELKQAPGQTGFPPSMPRRSEVVSMKEELVVPVRPALRALSFAVGLVLLIACANVVNLLLARTATRQREIAVKTALGAGRGRLTRQLLTESLVLALIGGVVGVGLARWAVPVIVHLSPPDIPRVEEIGFNFPLLIYSLALSSLVGAAVGLIPALRVARSDRIGAMTATDPNDTKSDLGVARVGSREIVIIGEIAMAMVLLIGAGLLIRSFIALVTVNPGYDARNVLTFQIVLPPDRISDPRGFYEDVMTRLEANPAVQAVGSTDVLPIAGASAFHFAIGGLPIAPSTGDTMVMRVVSRNYFRAMGIRVLEGRPFLASDGKGQRRVMLVNREFARRYFGITNPVGKIVGQTPLTYEVVGIVGNVRHEGLAADVQPEYYVELRQFELGQIPKPYFVIRSLAAPSELAPMIRSVVRQVDPQAGVDLNIETMADIVSASVARPRFYALLLGAFAGVALALAAIGIYGVMAYSVAQRTREIGIRAALGARSADLVALFLRRSVAMTVAGIVLGLGGAAAVTRSLEGMLFGLTPLDSVTFVLVSLLFAIVATMASYIPTRRATKVDPLVALRCE